MIDKTIKFFGVNIAILTISDTRNFDNDKYASGLRGRIEIACCKRPFTLIDLMP